MTARTATISTAAATTADSPASPTSTAMTATSARVPRRAGRDHKCAAGVALDCNDANACTTNQCDRTTGCGHTLIDADGDGYPPLTIAGCGTDCNDGQSAVKPGATELAGDGVDQNCDAAELCYADGDNDGYRTSLTVASADLDCDDPGEASATNPSGDCNDGVSAIRPGATEGAGDLVDQNCDGAELCYADGDNDGYRSGTLTVASADLDCNDPGEATAGVFVDCNDGSAAVNPAATEVCFNGIDDNCNSQSDEITQNASSPATGPARAGSATGGTAEMPSRPVPGSRAPAAGSTTCSS